MDRGKFSAATLAAVARQTAEQCLPQLEYLSAILFQQAELFAKEVNRTIDAHHRKGCETRSLVLSVRTQEGVWGPRLVWVRVGSTRRTDEKAATGEVTSRRTREVSMRNSVAVHLTTFKAVDEPLKTELIRFEEQAREIRAMVKAFRGFYNEMYAHAYKGPEKHLEGSGKASGMGYSHVGE